MTDLALALLCARASQAAYEFDGEKRGALLKAAGLNEVSYIQGAHDARALVAVTREVIVLAFQGTQFSEGEIASDFENVETSPVPLKLGQAVRGYMEQYKALSPYLPGADVVTGHSMGGAVAHLHLIVGLFANPCITFGAPKCADDAAWANVARPSRFVHERDFAPDWPPLGYTQPGPMLWLHEGKLVETDARDTLNISVTDHAIEKYVSALQGLQGTTS